MAFEPVHSVVKLIEGYPHPWCVCGGWAIDLFLGRETRDHEDVEILVYRRDQAALWQHFAYWSLVKIVPRPDDEPIITPWEQNEWLALPVHQIRSYAREDTWEFDLMLNEGDDDFWIYRRNTAVKRERSKAHRRTPDGIPYLAPEIALLYKSHHRRDKDEADFNHAHPLLDDEQRAWLINAIETCYPDNAWLDVLKKGS
jgi:hypothetical protein